MAKKSKAQQSPKVQTLNSVLARSNPAATKYLDGLDSFIRKQQKESPPVPLDDTARILIINALALKLRLMQNSREAEAMIKSIRLVNGRQAKAAQRESDAVAVMKRNMAFGIDHAVTQAGKAVGLGRSRLYEIAKKNELTKRG
jgi:hypothetical protein